MQNAIDELAVKRSCQKYGYNYRYFGNDVIIMTNVDEWRIEALDVKEENPNKYIIEHLNKVGNKSRKMQFHSQRFAPDIKYVFDIVISRHETYSDVFNKTFKIKKLLAEV